MFVFVMMPRPTETTRTDSLFPYATFIRSACLCVGAMALLARLPWSWQLALGTPLGALLRALLGERRRIALRNLELCFPGLNVTAREALLREHFRSLAIAVFEFARAWWG